MMQCLPYGKCSKHQAGMGLRLIEKIRCGQSTCKQKMEFIGDRTLLKG